jgi:hypothetical protein
MRTFFLLLVSSFSLGGCIYTEESSDDGYGGTSGYGSRPTSCTGGSGATGGSNTGGVVEPPPPPPECTDLAGEAACTDRTDCTPIYAGSDCTCGPDCTCIGGEPGCVCETYGYLVCIDVEDAAGLR